jgi:hypothetical protein
MNSIVADLGSRALLTPDSGSGWVKNKDLDLG